MPISRLKIIIATLFILLPLQQCLAADRDSIVWLSETASITGTSKIELYPIYNEAGNTYEQHASFSAISVVIRKALMAVGVTVIDKDKDEQPTQLALKTYLVHFTPGSIGGRWVGLGGGSSVCILRSVLVAGPSSEEIGEVITAKQVSVGGLFSAGAETYVCKQAAEQTTEKLIELMSMGLKSEKGEQE